MGKVNIEKHATLKFVTKKYLADNNMSHHIYIYTHIVLFKKIFSKNDIFSNHFNKSLTYILKGTRIALNFSEFKLEIR
ncbi:MAG: hypothetical protein FWG98_09585 [Candidatus Cloacimonetes bacterium]|nr:hypothetical protein [Candidatus Cloacimonadota bacterium]